MRAQLQRSAPLVQAKCAPMGGVRTTAAVGLVCLAIAGLIYEAFNWSALASAYHWWSPATFVVMGIAGFERIARRADAPNQAPATAFGIMWSIALVAIAVYFGLATRRALDIPQARSGEIIMLISIAGLVLMGVALPGPVSKSRK
jgi:hypothetical protein